MLIKLKAYIDAIAHDYAGVIYLKRKVIPSLLVSKFVKRIGRIGYDDLSGFDNSEISLMEKRLETAYFDVVL